MVMGPTEIGDKISVLAKFADGDLAPAVIKWQGRRHWVQKVNLHHTEKRGDDTTHYFSVTTEIGDAVLSYSQKFLFWRLVETNFSE